MQFQVLDDYINLVSIYFCSFTRIIQYIWKDVVSDLFKEWLTCGLLLQCSAHHCQNDEFCGSVTHFQSIFILLLVLIRLSIVTQKVKLYHFMDLQIVFKNFWHFVLCIIILYYLVHTILDILYLSCVWILLLSWEFPFLI